MDIREYFQKEQKGFYEIIAKVLTAGRRKQLYDAINDWHLKKVETMKTIAQQLNVNEFPFIIKDGKGNEIYFEYSDGAWSKYEFDAKGNKIYYENSDGFWTKSEFDSQGNEIYYEKSDGFWIKREYDSKGNKIYSKNSRGYWIKIEYNSQGNEIYYENSEGLIKDDRNIPEYSMEELIEKIGLFKLKTK